MTRGVKDTYKGHAVEIAFECYDKDADGLNSKRYSIKVDGEKIGTFVPITGDPTVGMDFAERYIDREFREWRESSMSGSNCEVEIRWKGDPQEVVSIIESEIALGDMGAFAKEQS